MGPTWVLSAPDGPHVDPMNLAMWDSSDLRWDQTSQNSPPHMGQLWSACCEHCVEKDYVFTRIVYVFILWYDVILIISLSKPHDLPVQWHIWTNSAYKLPSNVQKAGPHTVYLWLTLQNEMSWYKAEYLNSIILITVNWCSQWPSHTLAMKQRCWCLSWLFSFLFYLGINSNYNYCMSLKLHNWICYADSVQIYKYISVHMYEEEAILIL